MAGALLLVWGPATRRSPTGADMAIPAWLLGIFKPITELVDELHTSKEEKGQIEVALTGALTEAGVKILDYETKLAQAQSNIIIAEAQGQSWLQRNWRPVMMLTFGFIVLWNHALAPIFAWLFDAVLPELTLPGGLWTTIQIGIGGYIGGRSLEKITDSIMSRKK